jgi:hypothetical protein
MTTKLNTQCPNCQRWFTTQKSFKHHIRACRRAINGDTTSVIGNILPNPLLSASNSSISRQLSNHALDVNVHKSIEEADNNNFDVVYIDSDCQHDVETNQLDEQLASIPSITTNVSANNNSLDIMLHDLLQKHKASLLLYDEISNLFNNYLSSPTFDRFAKLKTRKALLLSMQKSMNTESLKPIDCVVQLHDYSLATVPVFNTKYMIISLLSDQKLMNDQFFPDGYNIFTGDVDESHPANNNYGEVHTGDAWLPARNRFCKDTSDMPVALILFADKSHTDLHGALSLTPIIFTLTLFNHFCT